MAEHAVVPSMGDTMKLFAQKITTSSVNERVRIFEDVQPFLSKDEFPDNAIKGILKQLLLTLPRYRDRKSRRTVEATIGLLATHKFDKFWPAFLAVLSDLTDQLKKIPTCDPHAVIALNALRWTVSAVMSLSPDQCKQLMAGPHFNKLVEIQGLLVYVGIGSSRKSVATAVYMKLKGVWNQVPGSLELYMNAVALVSENGMYLMCLLSLMFKFMVATKNKDLISQHKSASVDMYVKFILGSRVRPPRYLLRSCRDLLRHVDHDCFRSVMLPVVDKAMLRNPEVVLQAMCEMLGGLSIDLGQYAPQLGKHLATHCHSKDAEFRQMAIEASKYLAKQCSDSSAVENLVKHYFSVLNGSEGKLSVTDQRCGLVSGIGELSQHAVSSTMSTQQLNVAVIDMFIPVLKQEGHETTLTHTLSMFCRWCSLLAVDVPPTLTAWFKTALGLKTSTANVRTAYINCMSSTYRGDTLQRGAEMVSDLIQAVERAAGQQTQYQLVTEGLTAATFLLQLAAGQAVPENKMESTWKVILDPDKQLFTNSKFLTLASEEALQCVSVLVERLLGSHFDRLVEKSARPYHRALVYCLSQRCYAVRKQAQSSVKKLVSGLGGSEIALELLREFRNLLNAQKLSDMEVEQAEGGTDTARCPTPRILVEGLATICRMPNAEPAEAERVAHAVLLDAHHPIIVYYSVDTWVDIVASLRLDAAELVKNHTESVMADLKNADTISEAQMNMIQTLVRVGAAHILPQIMDYMASILRNPSLLTVTRDEVGIMHTPEGELFDKSVIQSGGQKEEATANIRRENKLYSYAEQMAEIELRKEIEKKKKAKSGVKDEKPKLSKKQEEAMRAQLTKEANIRNKLIQLERQIKNAHRLVVSLVKGNPAETRKVMPRLMSLIMALLRSPLAAPCAAQSFISLSEAAFEASDNYLAALVAQTTLRLRSSECDLDREWTGENLTSQASRTLLLLHKNTVGEKATRKFDGHKPYSAPTFCYCFYFLQSVLHNGGEKVGKMEAKILKALQIITAHTKLRSSPNVPAPDENGPELLPRQEIIKLCTQVIGTSPTRIQQNAAQALLETVSCSDGGEGCVCAGWGEVQALLDAMQSSSVAVREVGLQALLRLENVLPTPDDDYEHGLDVNRRLWIAKFDGEEEIENLAKQLWESDILAPQMCAELCPLLVDDVVHHEEVVRVAAAESLAAAMETESEQVPMLIAKLLELYQENLYLAPPVMDQFGRIISESPPDQFPARSGVAMALEKLSGFVPADEVEPLFAFFVDSGLGDRSEETRRHMVKAAVAAINYHGKENVSSLLPVFEDFLAKAPNEAKYDAVRQSVVILMGTLAKHLDKDDPKVTPIVVKLIETLSTPSQQVQEAVANCLPPLVPAIKSGAPDLVKQLLQLLLEADNYGERKGAAYGLAGLVRGLGILALKQLDIMTTLTDAIQNKKNPRYREGSLFALEMLCLMLGRLFEPYVVHILPHLLLCFGDTNQYVREAADDCAKAVMSKLSAHGVKLILPSLLTALEEESWRTKTGSVELLGAMAFCAPKQLSQCLPSIVPKLTEVLTDSHLKVQKAGCQALKQIGSVIKNPEIQEIVPILLDALQDPTKRTTSCLVRLLETRFVHFIDAPSLALIMPVVTRAFQDRSTETRKMAAQIIGNMYSLTDQKDLAPYLPAVIPGLKQSLLDPVPEVRSVSARALGAMVRGMGESGFEELVPWLMETLTSEVSSVDRSGAAQGLSEVVGGLGLEKLHNLMPDIIQTTESPDIAPHVRDGYIMMFIYLPGVFGEDFQDYVSPIIPSILQALADESEFVRDTALRAGQRIVNTYADTSINLLLPELEKGLFDDNWRIRYSSVQLLGDLLYKISGVSGKMSTESAGEDDNFGTETSQKAIFRTLGGERRNRVLAGLYMGRSDTALMVRQAALHVWKVIVTHTPKTLREILPTLFELLLGCLASQSYDKRQVAARTLGDIVRKLGEKVLPEIIPILERGLQSEQSDQRQGVCIGLTEIMTSTSRDQIQVYADSLVPTVRLALCDPLPEVRAAASSTFDNLHTNIGVRALDDILPDLLHKLDDPEVSEFALDGLQQVMSVKSRVVLPYLVPQLTAHPVNLRALSFLATVAGESLNRHLGKILPAVLGALCECSEGEEEAEQLGYCEAVVLAVEDDVGVRTVMEELLSTSSNNKGGLRYAAVRLLKGFCEQTKVDILEYVPQLFRGLLLLFTDTNEKVLHAAWDCLNAVTKSLDASDMLQHIPNLKLALRYALSDFKGTELPGFCLAKKGIAPILPIYREGILNGSQELKESAAVGLGDVIKRTSADALKPSVVNITGPLIRILGDRWSFNVKVAVLETLGLLLGKCGVMLRPFIPQLQTTFVKALNDPNRAVRLKAASALSQLVAVHPRADPLFMELVNNMKSAEDGAIRETTLQALRGCVVSAGSKVSDKVRRELVDSLETYLTSEEPATRTTAAACLGELCHYLPEDELSSLLNMHLLDSDPSVDWTIRHGRAVGLSIALKSAMDRLMAAEWANRAEQAAITYSAADRVPVSLSGLRAVAYLLRHQLAKGEVNKNYLLTINKCMKQDAVDVKQFVGRLVSFIGKQSAGALPMPMLKTLVPIMVLGTKEKNTVVRSNCEYALITLLRLRQGDDTYKKCASALEPGMRDTLSEVHSKSLKKLLLMPDVMDDEDIDDTALV